jgi:hypothetical protein
VRVSGRAVVPARITSLISWTQASDGMSEQAESEKESRTPDVVIERI